VVEWLCRRGASCRSTSSPVLSSVVENGALHVSLSETNGTSIWSHMPPNLDFLPDVRSPTLLAGAFDWVQEAPGTDTAVWVGLTGPGQDVGRWLYSTNRAYRYIPVWLVRALSLGVVSPRSVHLFARAIPTECPRRAWHLDDIQTLGAVAMQLRSELGFTSDQGVFLLQPYAQDGVIEFTVSALSNTFLATVHKLRDSPLMTAVVVVGFVAAFVLMCFVGNLLLFVLLFMIEGE